VHRFGDGRSDLASYVQVIQGDVDDLERMASLGGDQEEVPARERTGVLSNAGNAVWTRIEPLLPKRDLR
jgi:hypothetical protein